MLNRQGRPTAAGTTAIAPFASFSATSQLQAPTTVSATSTCVNREIDIGRSERDRLRFG